MLTLVFNGDFNNGIPVLSCSESYRISGEDGRVKEFTAQIADKTLDQIQSLFDSLTIEKLEIFNKDKVIFTSTGYTKLISVTNNITLTSPGVLFLSLRAE